MSFRNSLASVLVAGHPGHAHYWSTPRISQIDCFTLMIALGYRLCGSLAAVFLKVLMRFRHIEIFFAVMRYGTATAAAQHLGISQPSVTTALKSAEKELGFDLFHRQGRGLSPTPEARVLMEEVTRAHNSLEAIQTVANKLKDGAAGHLRIAAAPAIGHSIFSTAVSEFNDESNQYSYEVTSQHSDEILRNLDERNERYHLGFTFGIGQYSELSHLDIGRARLYCLMPKDWEGKFSGAFDVPALNEMPMISTFERDPLGSAARKLLRESGVQPHYVANVHNHQLAADLVGKGMGAAILESLTVENAMNGRDAESLSAHLLEDAEHLPVMAVYAQRSLLTTAAIRFVECMQLALQQRNY
jgi:DNA-binding transcriptional LysR family regulator